MPNTTRTLGPLHFEDLEPKRFEDLVRQLIHGYRAWRKLEATGRSGSDDGFDARGLEIVGDLNVDSALGEDSEEPAFSVNDRLWLIQCKREQRITPRKLVAYVDDIHLIDGEQLHGVIFAAACEFSKKSRDKFEEKCRAKNIRESYLWGKGELEDMLFRPENDGILFAYFGISLVFRRRSMRADLRALMTTKRKIKRHLGGLVNRDVLVRSPLATRYPDADSISDFQANPQWVVREYAGMCHRGMNFILRKYFAYISDDGSQWDAAIAFDHARATREDPWRLEQENSPQLRNDIWDIWNAFPPQNKAWLSVIGIIELNDVLEIDEIGDDVFEGPHVYVSFEPEPFDWVHAKLEDTRNSRITYPAGADDENRIILFPQEFRSQRTEVPAPTSLKPG